MKETNSKHVSTRVKQAIEYMYVHVYYDRSGNSLRILVGSALPPSALLSVFCSLCSGFCVRGSVLCALFSASDGEKLLLLFKYWQIYVNRTCLGFHRTLDLSRWLFIVIRVLQEHETRNTKHETRNTEHGTWNTASSRL